MIGDDYARILEPVGFVREHTIYYGEKIVKTGYGLRRKFFKLDFTEPTSKTNIELDGPGHATTTEEDAARDQILRGLGWRVIRIHHA